MDIYNPWKQVQNYFYHYSGCEFLITYIYEDHPKFRKILI